VNEGDQQASYLARWVWDWVDPRGRAHSPPVEREQVTRGCKAKKTRYSDLVCKLEIWLKNWVQTSILESVDDVRLQKHLTPPAKYNLDHTHNKHGQTLFIHDDSDCEYITSAKRNLRLLAF
jgi:hypothetical protein